jgi:hypothetical protein
MHLLFNPFIFWAVVTALWCLVASIILIRGILLGKWPIWYTRGWFALLGHVLFLDFKSLKKS